ncbi:MAG: isoprenylcysteine carboxylmethyltransferase family protein [Promethearchaeia archaeon]
MSWKENQLVLHSWGIFLVVEMILLWFTSPPSSALPIPWLEMLFWFIWIPGMIMIIIPFFKFRKEGNVKEGDFYENTQKLVDSGIFSIIRHPQYTGGMWIAIAMIFPNQSVEIIVFAGLAIAAFGLTIYIEEEKLVEKFGDEYKKYKKRTSACSFLIGLWRSYSWSRE